MTWTHVALEVIELYRQAVGPGLVVVGFLLIVWSMDRSRRP